MPIQRYEVDPLDGEYRCDSGNWVQYEDHLAEVAVLVGQRAKLLARLDASTPCYASYKEYSDTICGGDAESLCMECTANKALIAEISNSMIQSTHGKETDGPAVSD